MHQDGRWSGEITGTLVLVQEDRFRLQEDDGRSLLFILGVGKGPPLDDLEAWANAGKRIRVRYHGQPESGLVAEEVEAL